MDCRLKKTIITCENKYMAGTKGVIINKYYVEAVKVQMVEVKTNKGILVTNINNVAICRS